MCVWLSFLRLWYVWLREHLHTFRTIKSSIWRVLAVYRLCSGSMLRCRTMHPQKNMLRILDTVSEKVTVWQGWIENKVNQKRFYFSWNTTTHFKICNGCMGEPLWWLKLKCNRFSFPHIPSKFGAFLCSALQGWAPSQLPNSRPSCAKNTTAIRRRPAIFSRFSGSTQTCFTWKMCEKLWTYH